ncbi:hypothetical protein MJ579_17345 [Klebsiella pneumoniae]|nr:hypothetical protein MJ579_17345 [Klebsiella pneumoniae]
MVATATFSPRRQFGAPQTMSSKAFAADADFGDAQFVGVCADRTPPLRSTTTPLKLPATGSTPSTSRPRGDPIGKRSLSIAA